MASQESNAVILIKATGAIYLRCLRESSRAFLKNWWVPVAHLILANILLLSAVVLSALLGGLLGGFIAGILGAFALAGYFATVEVAVDRDRVSYRDIWPRTAALFCPFMTVLFVFYILLLVVGLSLSQSADLRFFIGVKLILVFLFNAAPEVVYHERSCSLDPLRQALEFLYENVIEWYVPFLIFAAVLWWNGYSAAVLLVTFASSSAVISGGLPVSGGEQGGLVGPLLKYFAWSLGFEDNPLFSILLTYVLVCFTYFVFIFRGYLYRALSGSTRRKRIYQYRFE